MKETCVECNWSQQMGGHAWCVTVGRCGHNANAAASIRHNALAVPLAKEKL